MPMHFLDRHTELNKLQQVLHRPQPQFVVLYGRRRIGKSTLIKRLLKDEERSIYFLADKTSEPSQRQLFAATAGTLLEGFDTVNYPTWESLLLHLNSLLPKKTTVCLDEFPYLVQSCQALPSILQKLLDSKSLKFNLVICGSSQHMMQGYVLDGNEPLYGRADEIVRLNPIAASFLPQALHCSKEQAVCEYAVWGGIPRYWELRANYSDMYSAVENLLLTPNGTLYDEPYRLLLDEMRDTAQASAILSYIGCGANRLSEIAARAEKKASDITPQLTRLRTLGLVVKDIPYGEKTENSKRGLYKINDPLLTFHYRYVFPYRSLLELGNSDCILRKIRNEEELFVSTIWEQLCREFVIGNTIDGVLYGNALRWWGNFFNREKNKYLPAEIDLVAESVDGNHLLIGECKWQDNVNIRHEKERLKEITAGLPFAKDKNIRYAVFTKRPTIKDNDILTYSVDDVLHD